MKIGIFSFEMYENRQKDSVGSSRIRCTWLMNHWPDAELYKIGKKYDVIIFQKVYFPRLMKEFDGIKILDMCDPDWLDGKAVKESIDLCDAVTTSSDNLRLFIQKMTDKPVEWIDDRIDLDKHKDRKQHVGTAKAVVWYGYHNNHSMIDGTLSTLKRLGLQLTVISDMPYYPSKSIAGVEEEWLVKNIKNIKYDPNTINQELIAGGDMVINPKSETGKYKFKSENKTHIAWAIGMPVAKTGEDVELFMDAGERTAEAERRLKDVAELHDVRHSVKQYEDLIALIAGGSTKRHAAP